MAKPIIVPTKFQDTLTGQLLIATPQIQDDIFHHAVIYMCAHNEEGAMGIIVSAPIQNLSINDILEQMQLSLRSADRSLPVMFGGPVEAHRGFVIHDGNYLQDTALISRDGITVTANAQALTGWVKGEFGGKALLTLGYAGWTPGQLESEIETGSWVAIPATQELIFNTPHESKWDVAVHSLGFDLGNLSSTAGHA